MELAARTSRAVAKAGSERAWVSWARKRGPVMFSWLAVVDDGLGDGGDVGVVERGLEGAAAMAGGSEGDALGGDCGVGAKGVVSGDEAGDVDEVGGEGWLAGGVGGLGAHAVWCPRGMMLSFAIYGMRGMVGMAGMVRVRDGGVTKKLVFDGWVRLELDESYLLI